MKTRMLTCPVCKKKIQVSIEEPLQDIECPICHSKLKVVKKLEMMEIRTSGQQKVSYSYHLTKI